MEVSWDTNGFYINRKHFFIQGINIFPDKRRLEKNPRWIYNPPVVSKVFINNLLPNLEQLGINTIRV
ncbi:MAG: hypothetical protein BAJALOKI1v1_1980006 [Promethearchaeota archaeon]|nr:MAG: hypothetical protein BAJALOKI1v1_1980006 [Candidatus Lokiarchaeota archaeon]